jgi:hypothetical protein
MKVEIKRKNRLGFELESCSRCGGSGKYSYCQSYGTKCFKCGGSGVTITKRGGAAREFFNESLKRHTNELEVGHLVQLTNGWVKILRIENEVTICKESIDQKEFEGREDIRLYFNNSSYQLSKDSKKESIVSYDDYDSKLMIALDHQLKLTKTGKLMKKYNKT